MGKQVTRLNEAQLHKVIEEATIRILRENKCNEGWIKNMFGATVITEDRINELSANTAGNAIKHAAYSRRERQMTDMADNTVEKYNKMYEFEDNGYTFKIERTNYDGIPTFFICIRNKDDRNYYKYIIAKDGRPAAPDGNYYDLYNSQIGYTIDNLKAGPRHKFKEMLKVIETLNKPIE